MAGLALLTAGAAAGWGLSHWQNLRAQASADASSSASATSKSAQRQPLYWYDPMKPDQHFDKPGKSPFMDMALEPKYADGDDTQPSGVRIDARSAQNLGVRLATATRRAMSHTLRAVGTVSLNERDIGIVQSRTAGFVERVYNRAPGDVVSRGAPLADVLVPEWAGAQAEYLALRKTGDVALTQASRQRLILLGMPPELVHRIETTGQPASTYTVTAPMPGVIQELAVRTGMTVAPGMTLARLNGITTVWLDVAVPEAQAGAVVTGQAVSASLPAFVGQTFAGKVAAVLPEGNRDSRTLRLRIELPNPDGRLKAGMSAELAIAGKADAALLIPSEAVIRTGRRALVYVADTSDQALGRYRPVEVQLGAEHDGFIEVTQGLQEGEHIVASGPFLIDSEASMQGLAAAPLGKDMAPASSTSSADRSATTASTATSTMSASHAPSYETRGVIVEIASDEITLKHEAVPALKWPGMTMPFQTAKPAVAQGFKVGDPVRFRFTMGDEGATIQSMQHDAGRARSQP